MFGNWWTWRKKDKPKPGTSYLANGKYSVKEVNHVLGRYAVVNSNEKDNWMYISYYNDRNKANELAEAYNRIVERTNSE